MGSSLEPIHHRLWLGLPARARVARGARLVAMLVTGNTDGAREGLAVEAAGVVLSSFRAYALDEPAVAIEQTPLCRPLGIGNDAASVGDLAVLQIVENLVRSHGRGNAEDVVCSTQP